ncbi:MAG: hypothetical protein MJ082_01990 [Clostridia bacterium]|nr:hypothetical protein [Clostridia bacterium]
MKKFISMLLVLALAIGAVAVLSSCGKEPVVPEPDGHTHEFGAWEADGPLKHVRFCACGENETADHDFETLTQPNENGMIVTKCKDCGLETYAYPWEKEAALKIWVTDNSQSGELLCGNRAFIAGQAYDSAIYTTQSLHVDDATLINLVLSRNNAAEQATKTKITYVWDTDKKWGQQMGEINGMITSGNVTTPDMFIGFVYDMVGVELKKNFRNLKDSTFFTFNHADYDAKKDDKGYFWDYMDSLAFSTKGKFLVASNYLVDDVRAYFITPVSIKLLKKTGITTDEFIELVNNNKYTWSLITDMTEGNAEKGIKGVGTVGTDGYTFNQNNTNAIWGFTIGGDGKLPIAGICYANSYSMITRTLVDGDYVYTYNDSANYSEMADSLQKTIGSSSAILPVMNESYDGISNDVICMQKAFSQERVLVGGVNLLGAIESTYFRNMWNEDEGKEGFIVTPMPLYHEGDEYRTVIHNLAKVIGVGKNSVNLDRCAGYIDYCSTNSADILNNYYEWTLANGAAGLFEANVEIIINMRNRLVFAIDKIVDDAISLTGQKGMVNGKEETLTKEFTFHRILLDHYQEGTGINKYYDRVKDAKQAAVNTLQNDFVEACTANQQ